MALKPILTHIATAIALDSALLTLCALLMTVLLLLQYYYYHHQPTPGLANFHKKNFLPAR